MNLAPGEAAEFTVAYPIENGEVVVTAQCSKCGRKLEFPFIIDPNDLGREHHCKQVCACGTKYEFALSAEGVTNESGRISTSRWPILDWFRNLFT